PSGSSRTRRAGRRVTRRAAPRADISRSVSDRGPSPPRDVRLTLARAILLDIEGTTTPISFVKDVLFPFARQNLAPFLAAHRREREIEAALVLLAAEREREKPDPTLPPATDDPLPYLSWLMDRDRKSTALKELQGRIWEAGYKTGAVVGDLYPDVA